MLQAHRERLAAAGLGGAGQRLRGALAGQDVAGLSDEAFLERLLATKQPLMFAESAVHGDGRDWTLAELGLLGDIGVAVQVEVFDDGRHQRPTPHPQPFEATLLFVPDPLLRNDMGNPPADWDAVTRSGRIHPQAHLARCERRLAPLFACANAEAAARGERAFITVPGLGCGQFARPFEASMGAHLECAFGAVLRRHARRWPAIRAVYYDPSTSAPTRASASRASSSWSGRSGRATRTSRSGCLRVATPRGRRISSAVGCSAWSPGTRSPGRGTTTMAERAAPTTASRPLRPAPCER